MKKNRRYFSPYTKIKIINEQVSSGISVKEICSRYALHEALFYRWRKDLLNSGHFVFESNKSNKSINKQIFKLELTPKQKANGMARGYCRRFV